MTIPLNRYQAVTAISVVIFVFGIVRAVGVFTGQSESEELDGGSMSSYSDTISLSSVEKDPFPSIGATSSRNPFSALSMWSSPKPRKLEPPPLSDLLRLVTSPVLLRRDALPRLGGVKKVSERRVDDKIITRFKRVFQQSGRVR